MEGAERRLRGIGEVAAALSRRDGGQDECGALGTAVGGISISRKRKELDRRP